MKSIKNRRKIAEEKDNVLRKVQEHEMDHFDNSTSCNVACACALAIISLYNGGKRRPTAKEDRF